MDLNLKIRHIHFSKYIYSKFALQTRAGTDAMGHTLRAAMDSDPQAVLVSLDGVGAYDHVYRAEFLGRLLDDVDLRPLLPFVRMCYDRTSRYVWTDGAGVAHLITQGGGGEQGDPLIPALFVLFRPAQGTRGGG